jgi:hypothetical protein
VSGTAGRTVTGGLQDLGKLRIAGVASISLVGLIHLLVTPEYSGFAAYLGLLMIATSRGRLSRWSGSTGDAFGVGGSE